MIIVFFISFSVYLQRQPSRGVPITRSSENMQPIYRRTPMPKCDFNKVAKQMEITLRNGCSPVILLYIFRTPFPKNTSGRMLLHLLSFLLAQSFCKNARSAQVLQSS